MSDALITEHVGLTYRTRPERPLMVDLFVPSDAPAPPLVVFFHGGAFRMGDRAMVSRALLELNVFEWLPRHGLAVASVDYRLSSEARWPACVDDAEDALSWLQERRHEFGIDTTRIAVWGESAGGYLALMAGLKTAAHSTSVKALIDWYAPVNFLTMAQQGAAGSDDADSPNSALLGSPVQTVPDLAWLANPCRLVQPHSPPLLIMHGTEDADVPFEQSLELAGAYRAAGAPVELVPVEQAGHLFRGIDSAALGTTVLTFLTRVL